MKCDRGVAATAALAPAPSVLTGLQTLPLKECDRLDASADLVRWLGGRAEVEGDHTLRIWPGADPGPRAPFNPRNDHRMAFAAAVGGLRYGGGGHGVCLHKPLRVLHVVQSGRGRRPVAPCAFQLGARAHERVVVT